MIFITMPAAIHYIHYTKTLFDHYYLVTWFAVIGINQPWANTRCWNKIVLMLGQFMHVYMSLCSLSFVNTVQCRYKNRSFRISPITCWNRTATDYNAHSSQGKGKKVGHLFGCSYLRLASINQVNKRLFCKHRTLSTFVKRPVKCY